MMTLTSFDRALYRYAIGCALFALVSYAGRHGRGWYLLSDGELVVATEIAL
jgi:hypothetical protein